MFIVEREKLSFVSHFSRRLPGGDRLGSFGDRDLERDPCRRCLIGDRLLFLPAELDRKGDLDLLLRVLQYI